LSESGTHLATDEWRIGAWIFSPAGNELRRGAERRRLENRVSRTLELLCRRRGAVVSQDEILAEVWNGRSITPSSVSVVIKDIRQALGDDAREPRHIETVAKRGYRLLPHPPEHPPHDLPPAGTASRWRHPRFALAAAVLILVAILSAVIARTGSSDRTHVRLIVTDVENATGSPGYQPLAAASGDLIILNTERLDGVRVLRGTGTGSVENAVTLTARLILWEGRPTVMLSAQNAAGILVWTSMTSGDEALIPSELSAAIESLGTAVRSKSAN
jgi:DNA-binding winged helix-turn-helix (wHTH) protein